jgi:hypothetical protein
MNHPISRPMLLGSPIGWAHHEWPPFRSSPACSTADNWVAWFVISALWSPHRANRHDYRAGGIEVFARDVTSLALTAACCRNLPSPH